MFAKHRIIERQGELRVELPSDDIIADVVQSIAVVTEISLVTRIEFNIGTHT
ncbi:hypothetical protein LAPA109805_14900 [Lacticaseibacillus paracasei]